MKKHLLVVTLLLQLCNINATPVKQAPAATVAGVFIILGTYVVGNQTMTWVKTRIPEFKIKFETDIVPSILTTDGISQRKNRMKKTEQLQTNNKELEEASQMYASLSEKTQRLIRR